MSEPNPANSDPGEATRLLDRARDGDVDARDQFYNLVYGQLVGIANKQLSYSNSPTINAHDLVHESFEKLLPSMDREWSGRSHFYGVAAKAMRQVLIDYARRKSAAKRGGDRVQVTLSGLGADRTLNLDELISLDDSLSRLELLNPRLRQVVELRFFAGLDEETIAQILGLSTRTVERDWLKAKMFLHRELFPDSDA